MSSAQDIIKSASSSLHARLLKALGFKKGGHTWTRGSDRVEVINLQLSQWNSASEAQFTLNFGIYLPELHRAVEALPVKGALKEHDCDVRTRIGALHPDGKDCWWTVSEATDAEELMESLHTEIATYGLPWFGALTTFESVAKEFAEKKRHLHAAVAYHLGGLSNKAQASMGIAYAECNELAKRKITRLARSLNIQIDV